MRQMIKLRNGRTPPTEHGFLAPVDLTAPKVAAGKNGSYITALTQPIANN